MPGDLIYLDINASTPCDPRVLDEMLPFLGSECGNPASRGHRAGQQAFAALEEARARVAQSLGARAPSEIVFTSGATEANNMALLGVAEASKARGRHVVTQATEHASVHAPLRELSRRGWHVTALGVDEAGRVRLEDLAAALRPDTVLVSLMLANNETGTLQPVRETVELTRSTGTLVHCDAAQGPGKVALDVAELGADLITLSAHKVYGPKGIGAVYRSRSAPLQNMVPLLYGGGQEGGLRPGTPNLPGAVGMAAALEIAAAQLTDDAARHGELRDRLERSIRARLDGCRINGDPVHRLPNTTNLSFDGVDGSALLVSLPDLAVSSGSACTSARPEPSPVLLAMGLPAELASASIRFSVGRHTTAEQVDRAADRVVAEVTRLRSQRRPRRRR